MRVTSRARELYGLSVLLAFLAVLLEQPLLLFGAAGTLSWLLGRQRAFAVAVTDFDDTLSITHEPETSTVKAGSDVSVRVAIDLENMDGVALIIDAEPPVAGELKASEIISVSDTESTVEFEYEITFHVAGTHELAPLSVTLDDQYHLFQETIQRGPCPEVVARSREQADSAVGSGVVDATEWFGADSNNVTERGIEPETIREYVPGDLAEHIDWNATARLGDLHIREFGTESDQHLTIILDQRETMRAGATGRRKIDYGAETVLQMLKQLDSSVNSVNIYTVDEDSILTSYRHNSAADAIATIHRLLSSWESNTIDDPQSAEQDSRFVISDNTLEQLSPGTTAFNTVLSQYILTTHDVTTDNRGPFQAAVQNDIELTDNAINLLAVTDDTQKQTLWEDIQRVNGLVEDMLLLLVPSVMHSATQLEQVADQYKEYEEFENFKESIERKSDAIVIEVGSSSTTGMS